MDWSKAERIQRLELSQAKVQHPRIFANESINRTLSCVLTIHNATGSLNARALQEIIQQLVQQGNAEWENKQQTSVLLFWRRPEDWATSVYNWVRRAWILSPSIRHWRLGILILFVPSLNCSTVMIPKIKVGDKPFSDQLCSTIQNSTV